jgi:NAD(P)-dependent dehydrogenase (short-subunit alcohol dehydrogenase family)
MSETAARVVLVTGASSGIGKVVAEHLARRGFRVFGTSRQAPPAAPSAGEVEMIALDVDAEASVQAGLEEVLKAAGRLDAVINNAGNAWMGSVEDTSLAEARGQLETNFFGVLRVCRAVLPVMRQQGCGHIVNISSLGGILGLPFSGLYSASKFAVEGMTESLRLEVRPFGIQVALIEPGDFRSQLATSRRTTAAAAAGGPYAAAFARFKAAQEADESKAPTPEPVAYLVENVLRDPHPALRQHVGVFMQTIVVPLKRYLPQRLFEWILRQALGLP